MIPTPNANTLNLAAIFCLAIAEWTRPARGDTGAGAGRVATNLALAAANLGIGLVLPLSASAAAALARAHGRGLLAGAGEAPGWGAFAAMTLAAATALSLANYLVHVAFHRIGWLWPLHAVHHRDAAVDLSTTLRTHPLAALIDGAVAALVMLALAPPVAVAALAAAILFAAALFEHADLRLDDRLCAVLERVLVTPRMHLVHHARARALHDSNYGQLFSLWDRLGGTYRAPVAEEFPLGLDGST